MNWKNVNLKNESEAEFLDGYTFDQLLLEISCNFKKEELTEEQVLKFAFSEIDLKVRLAKDILKDNISNIIEFSKKP